MYYHVQWQEGYLWLNKQPEKAMRLQNLAWQGDCSPIVGGALANSILWNKPAIAIVEVVVGCCQRSHINSTWFRDSLVSDVLPYVA